MKRGYVKLPVYVLELDMPSEAKVLYSIIADRISYSIYKDDKGRYYYLTRLEKIKLMHLIGCREGTYKKNLKILKENKLIFTVQQGSGVKYYLGVVGQKLTDLVGQKTIDRVGQILPDLYNQNNKPEQLKQSASDSKHNIDTVLIPKDNVQQPTFIDILKYWKEKNYHSDPSTFYMRYSLMNWVINGEPVRSWKKLADYWESCDFISAQVDIEQLPKDLADQVRKEQEMSGGRIRLATYKRLYEDSS